MKKKNGVSMLLMVVLGIILFPILIIFVLVKDYM